MNPLKTLFSALTNAATQGPVASPAFLADMLAPVSTASPCGESLEYDTEFAVLQARLQPRSEVQYGKFQSKPEGPDWVEIERDARRLLLRSKDISILIWFTRARCRMAGALGLLEGLSTLCAVLEAFPEQVHPHCVLEGRSDPAVRANALAALCDPEGLLGDVRDVVVSASSAFRLAVRDVERAFAFPRAPYAADPDAVRRQLRDLHARSDSALLALMACSECMQKVEQWSQAGLQDDAPSLRPLMNLLAAMVSFSDAPAPVNKLTADAVEPGDGHHRYAAMFPSERQAQLLISDDDQLHPEHGLDAMQMPAHHHASVQAEREQVRALLRHVRLWIEHHEPSSPVTILIKQADRMWGKRFSEVAGMIPPDLMQAWDRDD